MISVQSQDDLRDALRRSEEEPILLFKHSVSCPVSAWGRVMVSQIDFLPVYEIVVQSARPVSNEVATLLNVRHETPQAILVFEGRSVYNASHGSIDVGTIRHRHDQIVTQRPT